MTGGLSNLTILTGCAFSGGRTMDGFPPPPFVFGGSGVAALVAGCGWATAVLMPRAKANRRRGIFFIRTVPGLKALTSFRFDRRLRFVRYNGAKPETFRQCFTTQQSHDSGLGRFPARDR